MKIILVIEPEDKSYLAYLKPMFIGHQVAIIDKHVELLKQLTLKYDAIVTTRADLVERLSPTTKRVNMDNFAGSLFTWDGKPFLVLNPLRDLVSTPDGIFICKRYCRKITHPDEWFPQSPFTWQLVSDETAEQCFNELATADLIAPDIETTIGEPWVIKCVGYCGVWFNADGTFRTHSYVFPFSSMFWVGWVRKVNALACAKIFQNGLFDNTYFLRFGCPITNWSLDTLEFFHSWYSELPKRLDYIALFLLRDVVYWKDMGQSGDAKEFYEYNARDAWATANSFLALMCECSQGAIDNYNIKFPLVFPSISSSMEGFRYDLKEIDQNNPDSARQKRAVVVESSLGSLNKKLGTTRFNPGSWQQVRATMSAMDGKEHEESDEKYLLKWAKKHPLHRMIVDEILAYRENKKAITSYFDAELIADDRLLYSIITSGTDTGRLASRKHAFNVGTQVQNFPDYAKKIVLADEGFNFAEADNEKSEAVCLGYISGDENLIASATSDKDFHSINIERFFGVPYDEVWNTELGVTKNKVLRDLSKRVNHGTAYVMGAGVLLETMGLENVITAQILLGLPKNWGPIRVCEYLLERYHLAYPRVSADYYPWVKEFVKIHHELVSALGWTRVCFGRPWDNERQHKALIAHVPQNLSVGIINKGWLKVYKEIQLPNWEEFRLKMQIHDSLLAQYKIGRLDLAIQMRKILQQTIPVTDVKGKTRNMTIPVSLKAESNRWSDIHKIAA